MCIIRLKRIYHVYAYVFFPEINIILLKSRIRLTKSFHVIVEFVAGVQLEFFVEYQRHNYAPSPLRFGSVSQQYDIYCMYTVISNYSWSSENVLAVRRSLYSSAQVPSVFIAVGARWRHLHRFRDARLVQSASTNEKLLYNEPTTLYVHNIIIIL